MRRNITLLAGAAIGGLGAVLLRRKARIEAGAPASDAPVEALRVKLAQARETAADERDFQAAGMGAETMVEEDADLGAAPGDVEETRRRVHDEARAAAQEMRGSGEEAG